MNILAKTIAYVIAIISISANAEWSGKKKIKYLKAQERGIYFILDGFTDTFEGTNNCSSSFWMPKEEQGNYQARVSFLLAAYMSDREVNISYAVCDVSHIRASSVAL